MRLKANLKTIKEKQAEPKKIRGFGLDELSKENLKQQVQSEQRSQRIAYIFVMLYSLMMTFFPRMMMAYEQELGEIGISMQLIVYILFFNFLHWVVHKYRRFLVRKVGGITINALITYTYCCVAVALVVSNDVEWGRLFKPF